MSNLFCPMSEAAFVGCVIGSEGAALDHFPATSDHFFTVSARVVFTAALAIYAARSPVCAETVLQRLGEPGIEAAGGMFAATELCAGGLPSQAGYYFEILEGKRALRRAAEMGRWIAEEAAMTDDPTGFCAELQKRASDIETASSSDNVLGAVCDQIDAKINRMEEGRHEVAFITGVPGWEALFGGILEGCLYALAGRPGCGKTAMMEQLIGKYLACGQPVSVFEKDMSPQKLIERMACRALGIEYWTLARGLLKKESYEPLRGMIAELRKMPLSLYNPASLTPEKMCAIARRDIRTKGTRCVFLDHVQALRVGKDLREGLTQASLTLRANVTDTGVPHIVLAHINRDGAKGDRPKPEHIKEFDQLYGDCDGMGILWSEQDPAADEPEAGREVKFFAAKNRDGGTSEEKVLFQGRLMKFKRKLA